MRELDDLAMMKDPSRWPHRTMLPVKSSTKKEADGVFPKMGLVYPNIPTVHLSDGGVQKYDSFEAAVQDGWLVD